MKHTRHLKNQSGFTLMELLVTMLVLMILGTTIGGLVRTGLTSYGKIKSDAAYETEARTALSLITVQLRQHDETGAVTYDSANKRLELQDDPSYSAGNVIWFHKEDEDVQGTIYLAQVSDVGGLLPATGEATPVAEALNLEISDGITEDGKKTFAVTITYGADLANAKTLTQTITQRSQGTT